MHVAALLALFLAACGAVTSDTTATVDAGTDPVDAATTDAGPGEMTVRVLGPGRAPLPGVRAVITAADGTFRSTTTSDADGRITATIDPHSVVHVMYQEETSPGFTVSNLVSIVDAQPGDAIEVGGVLPAYDSSKAGQMMLDPSDQAVPAGATRFILNLGCDEFPVDLLPRFYPIPRRCVGADGKLTVLAEAYDEAGNLLGRAMRRNVPFVEGGNVDLPPWEAPGPGVSVSARLPASGTAFLTLAGYAHGVRMEDLRLAGTVEGDRAHADFPLTRGHADTYEAGLLHTRPADADHNVNAFAWTRRGPIAELERGLDVDLSARVPRLGSVSYDGAFHFDMSGDPAGSEALFFWLEWGKADGEGNWYIVAPPGTASPLRLSLHDLAGFGPPAGGPQWGEMWIFDLAGREGDYKFWKSVLGAWETSAARLSQLPEIDLVSSQVDLL